MALRDDYFKALFDPRRSDDRISRLAGLIGRMDDKIDLPSGASIAYVKGEQYAIKTPQGKIRYVNGKRAAARALLDADARSTHPKSIGGKKRFDGLKEYVEGGKMTEADQVVVKANEEMRYTLGVLYPPDITDLHGEWTTDTELHKAVIAYSMQGDKRLKLQHNESREVGTVVELMRWPYEVKVDIAVDGVQKAATLPAGTTYAGVVWDEEYWPLVKQGKIRGYSMGGRAMRVREEGANETVDVEKDPEVEKSAPFDPEDIFKRARTAGIRRRIWNPDKHPRWPAGAPFSWGGRFLDLDQVGSALMKGDTKSVDLSKVLGIGDAPYVQKVVVKNVPRGEGGFARVGVTLQAGNAKAYVYVDYKPGDKLNGETKAGQLVQILKNLNDGQMPGEAVAGQNAFNLRVAGKHQQFRDARLREMGGADPDTAEIAPGAAPVAHADMPWQEGRAADLQPGDIIEVGGREGEIVGHPKPVYDSSGAESRMEPDAYTAEVRMADGGGEIETVAFGANMVVGYKRPEAAEVPEARARERGFSVPDPSAPDPNDPPLKAGDKVEIDAKALLDAGVTLPEGASAVGLGDGDDRKIPAAVDVVAGDLVRIVLPDNRKVYVDRQDLRRVERRGADSAAAGDRPAKELRGKDVPIEGVKALQRDNGFAGAILRQKDGNILWTVHIADNNRALEALHQAGYLFDNPREGRFEITGLRAAGSGPQRERSEPGVTLPSAGRGARADAAVRADDPGLAPEERIKAALEVLGIAGDIVPLVDGWAVKIQGNNPRALRARVTDALRRRGWEARHDDVFLDQVNIQRKDAPAPAAPAAEDPAPDRHARTRQERQAPDPRRPRGAGSGRKELGAAVKEELQALGYPDAKIRRRQAGGVLVDIPRGDRNIYHRRREAMAALRNAGYDVRFQEKGNQFAVLRDRLNPEIGGQVGHRGGRPAGRLRIGDRQLAPMTDPPQYAPQRPGLGGQVRPESVRQIQPDARGDFDASELTDEVESHKIIQGNNINKVYVGQLKNGRKVILKPQAGLYANDNARIHANIRYADLEKEFNAGILGNIMNEVGFDQLIVPKAAIVRGKGFGNIRGDYIAHEFVPGRNAVNLGYSSYADVKDKPGAKEMVIFNAVIGNFDRHANNWMVRDGDGALIAIDNGLAFPEKNQGYGDRMLGYGYPQGLPLVEKDIERLKAFRARRSEIDKTLEGLTPDEHKMLWERVDWMIEKKRTPGESAWMRGLDPVRPLSIQGQGTQTREAARIREEKLRAEREAARRPALEARVERREKRLAEAQKALAALRENEEVLRALNPRYYRNMVLVTEQDVRRKETHLEAARAELAGI